MNGTRQDRIAAHFECMVQRDMKALPKRRGVVWESLGDGWGFGVKGLPISAHANAGRYVGFVAGYEVTNGAAADVANKLIDYWAARPDLHKWWELRQKDPRWAKHRRAWGK